MNRITEVLTNSLEPQMALIVYSDGHDFYIERRNIEKGKMGAGTPLTEKCLNDITEVISNTSENVLHGRIPSYMLFADSRPGYDTYIWFRKPEERMMYFTKHLNIPNGKMKLPGLIYKVKGTDLSIYAVKSKGRIGMKTKLFHAPFFNVYDSAKVCLGNAGLKYPDELTYQAIIRYWEDKFWLSEFDSLLGSNPVKGNLASVTKQCIKTGCEFPLDELRPMKSTLKSLLE